MRRQQLNKQKSTGQIINTPDIIIRGFTTLDNKKLSSIIMHELKKTLESKKGRVTNWFYVRKLIGNIAERAIFKEFRRSPLVLPVVIEV